MNSVLDSADLSVESFDSSDKGLNLLSNDGSLLDSGELDSFLKSVDSLLD